jgi:hypothetical protein
MAETDSFYSVLFILGLEYKEPIQYSHDYLKKIDLNKRFKNNEIQYKKIYNKNRSLKIYISTCYPSVDELEDYPSLEESNPIFI